MSKFIIIPTIYLIKFYQYFISPFFGNRCRFLPTCSEYSIESLNVHGLIKGLYLSIKRIFKCHPMKFLGGSSGLDFVPRRKKRGGE
tara:strand:- start:1768 stop:2025 length:258 start_codon:yes stop_codon:yes gene_type:complete